MAIVSDDSNFWRSMFLGRLGSKLRKLESANTKGVFCKEMVLIDHNDLMIHMNSINKILLKINKYYYIIIDMAVAINFIEIFANSNLIKIGKANSYIVELDLDEYNIISKKLIKQREDRYIFISCKNKLQIKNINIALKQNQNFDDIFWHFIFKLGDGCLLVRCWHRFDDEIALQVVSLELAELENFVKY